MRVGQLEDSVAAAMAQLAESQRERAHLQDQLLATAEQLQADMKRMDTFSEEVRRNLDEEAKAKQDLSHALGYFHRQMQLSSDERDVSHGRLSRLESEISSLQRKVHQLEAQVELHQVQDPQLWDLLLVPLAPEVDQDKHRLRRREARQ